MAHRTPLTFCPSCNHKIDAASILGDDDPKPDPGNFTVCMYCGHIMAFANDLTIRELTEEEKVEAAGNPDILEIQRMRKSLPFKEKQHTKDKLAAALLEIGLEQMAAKATEGYYHDFLSPLAMPEIQLVNDLQQAAAKYEDLPGTVKKIMALRSRVIAGDFDASREESDAWAESPEGQAAYRQLFEGH